MYNKYKCAHKRGLIKIAVCYNNNNFGVPPSLLPATALCCRGAFQSGWHGRRLPITVVGRSVGRRTRRNRMELEDNFIYHVNTALYCWVRAFLCLVIHIMRHSSTEWNITNR